MRKAAQWLLRDHLRPYSDKYWGEMEIILTGANLSGFDLSDCTIGRSDFSRAQFHGGSVFRGCIFKEGSTFEFATFNGHTTFSCARFEGGATFDFCKFLGGRHYRVWQSWAWNLNPRIEFDYEKKYNGPTVKVCADFRGADFKVSATFIGACFEQVAWFNVASFWSTIQFKNVKIQTSLEFYRAAVQLQVFDRYAIRHFPPGWRPGEATQDYRDGPWHELIAVDETTGERLYPASGPPMPTLTAETPNE